jgi:diguanylate cyclase (GGDEF)-like protein
MLEANPSLLIVDDIAANRTILARRFGRRGFQVTEAECALQALALIQQQTFDLILLDVMMPDLSGIDVLKRIRQQHSPMSLPVIMVTAKAEGSDIAEALAAGANDYVTKPVDFVAALARVNTQLERKRDKQAIERANESLLQVNENLEQRVAERTTELMRANEELKREIAERERSQAETHYLAHHDPLTGLGNRVLLREQIEQALAQARRTTETLAILFIDLDGFKSINDTLGHSIGDALLKGIAGRLQESLRESDKIARLGGDEFAVIQMAEEQPKGASALAARLINVIRTPYLVEGHQLMVGASVGIAVASPDKHDPERLLKSADLAMYRAKADGRGTYRFFEPEMDARAQARRLMEIDLRSASIDTAFELYYQPIVDLRANRVTCLEALLRWRHAQRGFIPPTEFIPLAEEIGVIGPLGEWVLRQACADAVNWPDHVKVAVNLSPVQFKHGGLLAAVSNALKISGLPASRLDLEITESVLLEKTDVNLATLNQLSDLGVRISMDDFGTGYSSLSYLRSFHFDKIKIDRSFVRDLANNSDSLAIVRAITDLGTSFGMTVIAEGVETQDQLKHVELEGCTEVQGFLFSPPRPASEIPLIIARLEQAEETLYPVRVQQVTNSKTPRRYALSTGT